MRVTMKSDYGLRAMIDLAVHYGQGPISSGDIAGRQYVPEHFLNQLLISLRRAGLLKSQRGPQGGHMLAKPPSGISMGEIIRALDGTTAPMECLPEPSVCQLSAGCAIRDVWRQVEEYAQTLIDGTTLEQLAERQRARAQGGEAMYYI
jgi:Rrf2 family protein